MRVGLDGARRDGVAVDIDAQRDRLKDVGKPGDAVLAIAGFINPDGPIAVVVLILDQQSPIVARW